MAWQLLGNIKGTPGPANELSIGWVATGDPGSLAAAEIVGTPPEQVLNLTVPRGDKGTTGDTGATGPANELSIGWVATGDPGSLAAAEIVGTPPEQVLNLTVPRGDKGTTGDTGATGPANSLSIGTVTTLAAGASATALISGTAPTQTLDLGIPQGQPGAVGSYQAKTANYTILSTDGTVAVDTTGGAVTLTLPSAAANSGKWLRIVKTASAAYGLTVQRAGSDTILPSNGSRTSFTFPSGCSTGEVMLYSTGSAWYVASGQASDETVGRRLWKWEQALAATSTTASVGFQLIYADTGWRDVAGSIDAAWTTDTFIHLVRRGAQVTLSARLKRASDGAARNGASTIYTLPTGFRCSSGGRVFGVAYRSTTGVLGIINDFGATHRLDAIFPTDTNTWATNDACRFTCVWTTDDAWPASLPGTASGTIPTFA